MPRKIFSANSRVFAFDFTKSSNVVTIMSGSLPVLPDALLAQLKVGGRLAAIVGDAPAMTAQIVTRISETGYDTLPLFETCLKSLRNAWRPDPFRF